MPRWLKHSLGILGVLTLAACSGGTTCSGLKPLPAGFNPDGRIENAASARLTQSGLEFLQANLAPLGTKLLEGQGMAVGGVIQFPIPESSGTSLGNKYTLCPGGPDVSTGKCIAEIDIGNAQITIKSASPHDIVAGGPVPIRVKNLPVHVDAIGFIPIDSTAVISGGGKGECDAATMKFLDVQVDVDLSIEVERDAAHGSRYGYTRIRIPQEGIKLATQAITDKLHFCPDNIGTTILNWFVPLLGNSLLGGFTGQIQSTIEQMLCQKADATQTPQCPNGSDPASGICKYQDGTCVSMMLGLDGNADLGALMGSISPGVTGGLDFLFAAGGLGARPDDPNMGWGDLNPVKSGATLGLMGGAIAVPQSDCVPAVKLDLPSKLPIPAELLDNTITPWTGDGPHVGVALSQAFANYALGGVYNSGALCIGMSTDQVALLHSGIISLLIPSIKFLTYQKKNQALAIVLRPQKPPTVTFGSGADLVDNPLVRVKLDQAMIDFYVFSSDRYVRILTGQFDFNVPINLDVTPAGIAPKLDKIYVTNPNVTNSELLKEDPAKIGKAIADVIQGMAGDFLGGIQPIAVNGMLGSLGVNLDIPSDGIRKLTSGQENFIGIFSRLVIPTSTTSLQTDTQVDLVSKFAPPETFRLTTHDEVNRPRLVLRMASSLDDGQHAIEYSYKLNRGYWHSWTRSKEIEIDDPGLMLQGRHELQVVSRIVGAPMSQDRTPAVLRFNMDVDAPRVTLARHEEGGFKVQADDMVSDRDQMMVRYHYDNAAPTEWVPIASLTKVPWVAQAKDVTLEVKDEEGNIGTSKVALIRGRTDKNPGGPPLPTTPSGCSMTPGASSPFGILVAMAAIGIAAMRRRDRSRSLRAAFGSLGAMVLAGSWAGCTCGSTSTPNPEPVIPADDAATEQTPVIPLEQGLIGSYTSTAVASDGTIWVAGYEEADWDNGMSYGDLAVGKYDASINRVDWELVDGVPSTPAPDPTVYDVHGWRGGQTESGDDVGLWTSLALQGEQPRVAYYDSTHGALKYASYDGASWRSHTVYQKEFTEAGRYAKLIFVGGKPAIAFQVVGPAVPGGFVHSALVVAHATSATPGSAGDWAFDEVDVNDSTPCRQKYCVGGEKCAASTFKCTLAGTCTPDCASGTACFDGGCATIIDNTKIDSYPEALGGYISIAVGPNDQLGMVYYDRVHGNLMQAWQTGGEWQATKVLDGQSGSPPVDTGDVGIGASLFITSTGDWHVAYADGFKESLKYMLIKGGTEPQPPELVDPGTGAGGQKFGDGQHIVGDDSNITVTKEGDVHIAYQDATVGRLRWAVGTAQSGSGHAWEVKVLDQEGFAGFFPKQISTDTSTKIVNWWRKAGAKTVGDVRIVTP